MKYTDVKGYYEQLGVASGATQDEIKRAYRDKVKETHPDGGGNDTNAFQRVREAYGILGNPTARAEYDKLCRDLQRIEVDAARKRAERRAQEQERRQAEVRRREAQRHQAAQKKAQSKRAAAARATPRPEPHPADTSQATSQATRPLAPDANSLLEPCRCRRCGTITAQPRYVVFTRVIGLIAESLVKRIEGIFCRECADIVAIRASLVTWLLGWWSLPRGPLDTIRALMRNIAGGEKPVARNADLLARQARAFAARGEMSLAGDLARQANAFRRDPDLDRLIKANEGRRLKDRWAIGGPAFIIQTLPIGVLLAWLLVRGSVYGWQVVTAPSDVIDDGPQTIADTEQSANEETAPPPPAASGQDLPTAKAQPPAPAIAAPVSAPTDLRYVAVAEAQMRRGAGLGFPLVDRLPQFTTVRTTGDSTLDGWVPIVTETELRGYVPLESLTPGSLARQLWCTENAGARPVSGEILKQHTQGDHALGVKNAGATDAIVKLRDQTGQSVLLAYVRGNEETVFNSVPEGTYSVSYATGGGYSTACKRFLDGMTAYVFNKPVTFATATVGEYVMTRKLTVTLSASDQDKQIVRQTDAAKFLSQ